MFQSDHLVMESDHLDLSFRDTESWPSALKGSANHRIRLGDPAEGPVFGVGATTPFEGVPHDWEHDVDPMHFHGSDQFRLIVDGQWIVAREPMNRREFGFQDSGRVYQEHPGPDNFSWRLTSYGDRRGVAATLTRARDREHFRGKTEVYGEPVTGGASYPHPAGPKGVAAVATTAGPPRRGYAQASFADTADWRALGDDGRVYAAVWGAANAGPIACMMTHGPGAVVVPAAIFSTELILVFVQGGCRIGERDYGFGDVRIQRADVRLPEVLAGRGGSEVALVIADRRARIDLADSTDAGARTWRDAISAIVDELNAAGRRVAARS